VEPTKLKTILINLLVATLLLIIGGFLNNYFFKDIPALTYNSIEGDPIETEMGNYYPTSLVIHNTGDVPLSAVRIFLKFGSKIVKVTSNIYGDRNEDDSLNIKREFRMPKGTFVEMHITSRGKLLNTYISSAEVVASKESGLANGQSKSLFDQLFPFFLGGLVVFYILSIFSNELMGFFKKR
jgi:hypothetical protein